MFRKQGKSAFKLSDRLSKRLNRIDKNHISTNEKDEFIQKVTEPAKMMTDEEKAAFYKQLEENSAKIAELKETNPEIFEDKKPTTIEEL